MNGWTVTWNVYLQLLLQEPHFKFWKHRCDILEPIHPFQHHCWLTVNYPYVSFMFAGLPLANNNNSWGGLVSFQPIVHLHLLKNSKSYRDECVTWSFSKGISKTHQNPRICIYLKSYKKHQKLLRSEKEKLKLCGHVWVYSRLSILYFL